MDNLFTEARFGKINASNRFVMAPMSRNRATAEGLATPLMATYYAQRATAGLIISEGIQPNQIGQGFMNSPGLHNLQHVKSWQPITEAVHKRGGKIVAQLMHSGRIGHPELYPSAHQSIAPSAIKATGDAFTPTGPKSYPTPKEMTLDEITATIEDFAKSAELAIQAGFDGVEIHAGNGFLLHQFMASNTNNRADLFGGSVKNRLRFTLKVVAAVTQAIGAKRVGIRISPDNTYNDIIEQDSEVLYQTLISQLPTDLAYLHIMEAANREHTQQIRNQWLGKLILNPHKSWQDGPVTPAIASDVLNENLCDGVALGALFLANPDLVERTKLNASFNNVDPDTFYGGDETGYTDYPTMVDKSASLSEKQSESILERVELS